MKTLSVKQPWVYLIFANIKPIENRTWPCPKKYIGERILIHASAKPDDRHRDMSLLFTKNQWEKITIEKLESYMSHGLWIYSAIIGSVEIVDCVLNHTSIWAEKTNFMRGDKPIYNWILANPIVFDKPIKNITGKLSFWEYELPEEYKQEIARKLKS